MTHPTLTLELWNGPLDGHTVTLEAETAWSRTGDGPLSFPWDAELGTPQARFRLEEGRWWLETTGARRTTRHNMEPVTDKVPLTTGGLLKAAESWLLITGLE